jgi:sulfatase maturation enzyme AslB (radical SAM superfamily)
VETTKLFDVIKKIFNKLELKDYSIQLVLAMNEPLFNIDLLNNISNYFHLLCKYNNSTFRIMFSTNGTLLSNKKVREYLNKTRGFNHTYLSLDGYKDVQDINRPGSWDSIIENWDFLKNYTHNSIHLNSVFYKESMNIVADSYIKLLTEFDGITSINLLRDKNNSVEDTEYLRQYLYTLEEIAKYCSLNKPAIQIAQLELKDGAPSNTCDSIYIDKDGNIYTCNSKARVKNIADYKTIKDFNHGRDYPPRCEKCEYTRCRPCGATNEKSLDTVCYLMKQFDILSKKYYSHHII